MRQRGWLTIHHRHIDQSHNIPGYALIDAVEMGRSLAIDRLNEPDGFRDFPIATVRTVQEALVDMHARNTGIPATQVLDELRQKHGLTKER